MNNRTKARELQEELQESILKAIDRFKWTNNTHIASMIMDVARDELKVILGCGYLGLFVAVKRLLDYLELSPMEFAAIGGVTNESYVAYLLGMTDISPDDTKTYHYGENYWWERIEPEILMEMNIPCARYDDAIGFFEDYEETIDVQELEEEGGYRAAVIRVKQYKPSREWELSAGEISIVLREDAKMDMLSDFAETLHEVEKMDSSSRWIIALSWIKDQVREWGEDHDSNGLAGLPFLHNESVIKEMLLADPYDLTEVANCITEAMYIRSQRFTEMAGLTKVIFELAYYKQSKPEEFFKSFVKHLGLEEMVDEQNLQNCGSDAELERIINCVGGFSEEEREWRIEELVFDFLRGRLEEEKMDALTKYKNMKSEIQKKVIGNEELVEGLAIALTSSAGMMKRANAEGGAYPSQNMLIIGGTGTGKTFTVKAAAEAAGRTFIDINMAEITAPGYKGKDLSSVFLSKVSSLSQWDVENAVVFFDEVDKVIHTEARREWDRRFDVIPELLKLIEGDKVSLESREKVLEISTKNMLFIFAGAFEDVNKIIHKRKDWGKKVGFELEGDANKCEVNDDRIISEIEVDDLEKYGLTRQLLGRMNRVFIIKPLSEEGYKKILTESSESAFIKQKKLLRDVYEVDLKMTDKAIKTIAHRCAEMKVGARGLNSIINTAVSKGLAEMMSAENVVGLILDLNETGEIACVQDNSAPL